MILNVPVNNFSVMLGQSHRFLGIPVLLGNPIWVKASFQGLHQNQQANDMTLWLLGIQLSVVIISSKEYQLAYGRSNLVSNGLVLGVRV